MISTTYRKFLFYGLALMGIVIMITMPDVVIGFLFEVVHFFFELLFIIFEWVESTLDKLVEHLFHTELHETQTIVFYLMVGIILLPLYYLWRMLLRLFFRLKETLLAAWTLNKIRANLFWQNLSLIDKIKWIAITIGAIYLASFLFM
ncbi:MAG: hypothetical protein LUO95_12055 [Methylococcaceae bacterium]|nr:hypothetical protein [Methylococcaceae bacterium]